jgi:hypothetical protein
LRFSCIRSTRYINAAGHLEYSSCDQLQTVN